MYFSRLLKKSSFLSIFLLSAALCSAPMYGQEGEHTKTTATDSSEAVSKEDNELLRSVRIITPGTSTLHGAALAFVGWSLFMIAGVSSKGYVKGSTTRDILFPLLTSLGSMATGSLGGWLAGFIHQRWFHKSAYGLFIRNSISYAVVSVSTLVGYYSSRDYFKKENQKTALVWGIVAPLLFLAITESIGYRRDKVVKTFPRKVTILSSMGHGYLVGAVAWSFLSILVLLKEGQQEDLSKYQALGNILGVLLASLIGAIGGLIAGVIHYFFLTKTRHARHYRNGITALPLLILMILGLFDIKKEYMLLISTGCGLLYMALIEVAYAYYLRLLAAYSEQQGAAMDHSQPKEVQTA